MRTGSPGAGGAEADKKALNGRNQARRLSRVGNAFEKKDPGTPLAVAR